LELIILKRFHPFQSSDEGI